MAQHDYVINNDSGANVRADINTALLAISSNNSGSSAPSTTYAYEWFIDTANSLLKIRNAANNAYITVPIDIANSNRTPDSLTIGTAAAGDRTVTINSAGTPFGSIEANNSGTKIKLTAGNTGSAGCSMEFYTAASSGTETLAFTLGADQSALFAGAMTVTGATQFNNTVTVGVDDTGYDVKLFGDTASAYMLWDTSVDDLVLAGAAGIDVAGDIDVDGISNLDNTDIDGTLAVDGTTISLDATTSLNIDNSNTSNGVTIATATTGVPVSIGHTTSEVTVNDNLTVTGTITLGSGAELSEAELEMLDGITAGTVAASKAVVVDSNKDAASFRNITLTGELDAGSLDVSGDVDIDGTLETDALSIGDVTITATAAQLNYVAGVTSAVQTQLDTKASTGKAIAMAMVFG
jgi:hypothetical protein